MISAKTVQGDDCQYTHPKYPVKKQLIALASAVLTTIESAGSPNLLRS